MRAAAMVRALVLEVSEYVLVPGYYYMSCTLHNVVGTCSTSYVVATYVVGSYVVVPTYILPT